MDILNNFGVQPILLLAQVVNFLVLLFILQKFLYKPILKVLQERKDKAAKTLRDSEEAQKRLQQATEEVEKMMLRQVEKDKQAREQMEKLRAQMLQEAKDEFTRIVAEAQPAIDEQLKLRDENMQKKFRQEAAQMVTLGIQKVTGKIITKKEEQDLIKKTVKEV